MAPVLYQVGPIALRVRPLNANAATYTGETSLPRKEIMGGDDLIEHTGERDRTLSLSGHCWPDMFGGEGLLDAFDIARRAGVPMFVMRGGRRPLGWYACERFEHGHTHLRADGVGKIVTIEMDLIACGRPVGAAAIMSVMSLFS